MFTIFYTNFGYGPEMEFMDFEGALEYGKSKGFDFKMYMDKKLVGWYSVINGWKFYA